MNSVHEHRPYAPSRMGSRHEEVVDIATRLNVRVANDPIAILYEERVDFANFFSPQLSIKVLRSPGVNLIRRVVARGNPMDGRKIDVP